MDGMGIDNKGDVVMCLTCGCQRYFDDHGNIANLTLPEFEAAAIAGKVTMSQLQKNVDHGLEMALSTLTPSQQAAKALVKPDLLFDIDGVLGMLTETIVTALNSHFGTSLVVSNMTNYWIESVISPAMSDWLTAQFEEPVLYENIAADLAGIAAVQALHADGFKVIISSDRPANTQNATIRWLKKWNIPYDQLFINGPNSKLKVADRHNQKQPLIAFDDDPRKGDPKNPRCLVAPGIQVWSPERPWTPVQYGNYPGVWVFKGWQDVLIKLGVDPDVPIPGFTRPAGNAVRAQGVMPPVTPLRAGAG